MAYLQTPEKFRSGPKTQGVKRSALQDMLMEASHPDVLSFALGLPAAELFPVTAFSEAIIQALSADQRAMQYGPPYHPLKERIVRLMDRRGVRCEVEQVFLTSGAQQGLSLLTQLLLKPGGCVITEELTYTGFQQVLEPYHPRILPVPTDLDTGMEVGAVERWIRQGERPAFIYTVTNGHNPLAVSLSPGKRRQLAELAERYGAPIIEDDPYGFLSYEDTPPPLRALSDQWVFYVGSFSKILAPALRVGWIIAPESICSALSNIKEANDINTSTLNQRAIAAFIDGGHLETHLPMLRSEYVLRRDAMLNALDRHFPRGARWRKPTNGVFIWVELPQEIDAETALKAALETERIAFIPGNAFRVNNHQRSSHCIRLNFSNSSAASIEEGIARLARLLHKMLNG
jgi:2-aminoadipate transaminase